MLKSDGLFPVVETYTSTPSAYVAFPALASNLSSFGFVLVGRVIAGVIIQSFAVPAEGEN